jgi:hypothetical protein
MKCIVELLIEVKDQSELQFAERFNLRSLDSAQGQKLDFDNWLRRCVEPRRRFIDLDEAYGGYIKSFG